MLHLYLYVRVGQEQLSKGLLHQTLRVKATKAEEWTWRWTTARKRQVNVDQEAVDQSLPPAYTREPSGGLRVDQTGWKAARAGFVRIQNDSNVCRVKFRVKLFRACEKMWPRIYFDTRSFYASASGHISVRIFICAGQGGHEKQQVEPRARVQLTTRFRRRRTPGTLSQRRSASRRSGEPQA